MDLTTLFNASRTPSATCNVNKDVVTSVSGFKESGGIESSIRSENKNSFHASQIQVFDDASSLKHANNFVVDLIDGDNERKPVVLEDVIAGQPKNTISQNSEEGYHRATISNEVFNMQSNLEYNPRSYSVNNSTQYSNCYGISHVDPNVYAAPSNVEKHFPCTYCGKSFSNIASFTRHVRSHEAELPFRCSICFKAFPEKKQLDSHLLTHHQGMLYTCDRCDQSFSQNSHLIEHMKSHSVENNFLNSKESFNNQPESHVGRQPFRCGICDETFTLKAVFISHITTHSARKNDQPRDNSENRRQELEALKDLKGIAGIEMFPCSVCGQAFKQTPHLRKHLESHSTEELSADSTKSPQNLNETHLTKDSQIKKLPFLQDTLDVEAHCRRNVIQKQQLPQPFQSEDESSEEISSDDQLPAYRRENSLSGTSVVHHNKNEQHVQSSKSLPITCHVPSSYERERYLSGGNPVCHSVSNAFSGESTLIEHLQSYNEVKPFQCTLCKQSFSEKAQVLDHLKTHTGNEVYRCSICEQEFNSQKNLSQHMQLHTGENPFRCQYCDRAFRQKSRLNKHLKIHTGVKPFPCDICDKKFRLRRALDAHIRSHTGQKPFFCNICEKGFSYQASYNKHLSFQH